MVKVICWNTNHRKEPWRWLHHSDADVALVQEACNPPFDVLDHIEIGPGEHWDAAMWNSDWWTDRFSTLSDRQTMVVKLSDRVRIEWFKQVGPISMVKEDEIAVSGIGTIAAARVVPLEGDLEPFIAVSIVCAMDRAASIHSKQVACRLLRRHGAPNHLRPVGVHRQCGPFDPPHTGSRRPQPDLWLQDRRSAGAGRTRERRLREDGNHRPRIDRATVPGRENGHPHAELSGAGHPKRAYLPHCEGGPSDCQSAT